MQWLSVCCARRGKVVELACLYSLLLLFVSFRTVVSLDAKCFQKQEAVCCVAAVTRGDKTRRPPHASDFSIWHTRFLCSNSHVGMRLRHFLTLRDGIEQVQTLLIVIVSAETGSVPFVWKFCFDMQQFAEMGSCIWSLPCEWFVVQFQNDPRVTVL